MQRAFQLAVVVTTIGLLQSAGTAHAQWLPDYQKYQVRRLGFFGSGYTGSTGYQFSAAEFIGAESRQVSGYSFSIAGQASTRDRDTWTWTPETGTVQTGLFGPDYFNVSFQQRYGQTTVQNRSGLVGGSQDRSAPGNISLGAGAWVWTPQTGNVRVGLFGPANTFVTSGVNGFQLSTIAFVNSSSNFVLGGSQRQVSGSPIGDNLWAWTPTLGTVQIGLTSAAHTTDSGYQRSRFLKSTSSGSVLNYDNSVIFGRSDRFTGVGATTNGVNFWAWSATMGTTQLGFFDAAHTGAGGYQDGEVGTNAALTAVGGSSRRYRSDGTQIGEDAWTWTELGGTVQIGLVDAAHTGSSGGQYNNFRKANASGQIIGTTVRPAAAGGNSSWIWRPSFGTTAIGLTSAEYTGSSGYRASRSVFFTDKGDVAGESDRVTGVRTNLGRDTWVWTEATGTVRTGLVGADYTRVDGYRTSAAQFLSNGGLAAGKTQRLIAATGEDNGSDTWVWSAATGNVQIGISSPQHRGSGGYQFSQISSFRESGSVLGFSKRIRNASDSNGQNAWYWSASTGTVPMGLDGPGYISTSGLQFSGPFQGMTVLGQYEYGYSGRVQPSGVGLGGGRSV